MVPESIDPSCPKASTIHSALASIPLSAIREVLPDRAIVQACREAGYSFRHRLLVPMVTVLHMVLAAIWPEESFNASWEVLWSAFRSRYPQGPRRSPSRSSVTKARGRLPLAVWQALFEWVSHQGQRLSEPWARWRDHRVVLVDGTCVSMPDTPALWAAFGTQGGAHGTARYPLARLVAFSLAHTMSVMSYAIGRYRQDENALAEPLLNALQHGDLLLADRHFAGAHLYVRYQRAGLEFLTRIHQRLKLSRIQRLWLYGPHDFVGRLKVTACYRRQDPTLPAWIPVRFLRTRWIVRGHVRTVWLVTSLLDAQRYPAAEIVDLYARRWRIETLLRDLKIGLSADVLRSQTPEGIHKEVAARLIALNVVRSVMLQAAAEKGLEDPLRLSFVFALRAILSFSPALRLEPFWKLRSIYQAMLDEIAAHTVPWRPRRNKPRRIRRDRKHYPMLATTRAEWRNAYAA
jgi:hypothetical protein